MKKSGREFLVIFEKKQPIVVLHGTDTMVQTAIYCYEHCSNPPVSVVFTGAMKPVGFEDSDATQNFIEALCLCQVVVPGFYISFHNQIFKVPHVKKNRRRRTFGNFVFRIVFKKLRPLSYKKSFYFSLKTQN